MNAQSDTMAPALDVPVDQGAVVTNDPGANAAPATVDADTQDQSPAATGSATPEDNAGLSLPPSREDIDLLRASNYYTPSQINAFIDRQRPVWLAAGISSNQVDQYYGVKSFDSKSLADTMMSAVMDAWNNPSGMSLNDAVNEGLQALRSVGAVVGEASGATTGYLARQAAEAGQSIENAWDNGGEAIRHQFDDGPSWGDVAGAYWDNSVAGIQLAKMSGQTQPLPALPSEADTPLLKQIAGKTVRFIGDGPAVVGGAGLAAAGLAFGGAAGATLLALAAAAGWAAPDLVRSHLAHSYSMGAAETYDDFLKLSAQGINDFRKSFVSFCAGIVGWEAAGMTMEMLPVSAPVKELIQAAPVRYAINAGKSSVKGATAATTAELSNGSVPSMKELLLAATIGALLPLPGEHGDVTPVEAQSEVTEAGAMQGANPPPPAGAAATADAEGARTLEPTPAPAAPSVTWATSMRNATTNTMNLWAQSNVHPAIVAREAMLNSAFRRELVSANPDFAEFLQKVGVRPNEAAPAASSSIVANTPNSSTLESENTQLGRLEGDTMKEGGSTPPNEHSPDWNLGTAPIDFERQHPQFKQFLMGKTYSETSQGFQQAVTDFLNEMGEADKSEHAVLVDPETNTVVHHETIGKPNQVRLSPEATQLLYNKDKRYLVVHNHLDDSPVSWEEDLDALNFPGVGQVIAVGPKGGHAAAGLTEGMRNYIGNLPFPENVDTIPRLIMSAHEGMMGAIKSLRERGELRNLPSKIFQREVINRALKKTDVIQYHSSYGIDEVKPEIYSKIETSAMRAVTNSLNTDDMK